MRRYTSLWLALLLVLGVVSCPYVVMANANLSKITQQLNQVQEEKKASQRKMLDAEQQIKALKQKKQETSQQMTGLLDEIDRVSTQLDKLQSNGKSASAQLAQNAADLQNAVDRVAQRNQMLADKLRFLYMNGSSSFLDVLMHATSFSDFIGRFDSMKQIAQFDHTVMVRNEQDKQLIAEKQATLQQEVAQIQQQMQTVQQQQRQLVAQKNANKVKIASYSNQEQQLDEMSSAEDEALQRLADKEAALLEQKSELESQSDTQSNSQSDSSSSYPKPPFSSKSDYANTPKGNYLYWPLGKNYVITSPYGYRTDPISGKRGSFHDGIDIGAPSGTPILAAQAGTVIVAQWYGSAGNAVIIDHGHGIRTMYDHMRTGTFKVKPGDHVKVGQELGLVGMTGYATGPHLHFGVYYNGKNIDPWQLLKDR